MIQAVIFDWAGTTVDYGCFAPVQAFQEAFAHHGVPVTLEETRKPMGMLKRDHIRTMLRMERIARAWEETHGRPAGEEDVEAVYALFEPKLFSILDRFSTPKPFAVETAAALREMGLKIGSTTGYTDSMMHIVAPKAARLGYAPDFWISPDGVGGRGRPYPYMIFANMQALGLTAVGNVVKVGDTISDIRRYRGQLRARAEPAGVRGHVSPGAGDGLPEGGGAIPEGWCPFCCPGSVPVTRSGSCLRL